MQMQMTVYAAPTQLKATQLSISGWFCGYAALFNGHNTPGVAFAPGAFSSSLRRVKTATLSGTPLLPLLWQRDPHEPIGGITSAVEDATGLRVEGFFDRDIAQGERAYSAAKKGYAQGLCVVGEAVKSTSKVGGTYVTEAQLRGVSLVSGATAGARITEVKSTGRSQAVHSESEQLDQIGLLCLMLEIQHQRREWLRLLS